MAPNKFTILIVDDTSTNLLILKKTLMGAGYQVLTAENGKEGRALAEANSPDLILLDIMMPGEDGFETIVKLKSTPATVSIPVIFLTALSDVDAKVRGFELGAVDFITKPFHPAEIRARVSLQIKLNIATNALILSQAEKLKQIGDAQQALLVRPDELPEAKFHSHYISLHEAGGDFYDVVRVSENVFGYFLADVSGHDIGTSFVTAAVKALLRQNCSPIYSPTESMQIVNRVLLGVLPEGKYLTACYMTVDRKAMDASIVNMGHPPVIYQPAAGKAQALSLESDVLGAFNEALYSEHEFKVSRGDRIYAYSDGLVEGSNGNNVWTSGVDGLVSFIEALRPLPLNEAVEAISSHYHPGSDLSSDDIVVMGVEV